MIPHPSHRRLAGLTLIEVMVVLLILGVMAAFIVPNVIGRSDEAKVVAARADVATLMQSLKLYRLDNGRYPSQEQGLNALTAKPALDPMPSNYKPGGYIDRLPNDPWGGKYQFLNPGVKGEIDVYSFGADGKPNGQGFDADVGNWNL